MIKRKKKELDGIDREILRLLYKKGRTVSNRISEYVGLSASAIFPRLNNLLEKGIIKKEEAGKERVFYRKVGGKKIKIKSKRMIYWEIDLKK